MDNNSIKKKSFKEIDLNDIFFDSLKSDYPGFERWYLKKSMNDEEAYVLEDEGIQGFLYLKEENEEDITIKPTLDKKRRLKVGTFKINAHGTRLGERFIKIIIDEIYKGNFDEAYVTIFPKHASLIDLLSRFGFTYHGVKESQSGVENVYIKYANKVSNDLYLDYPKINLKDNKKFLLSIWPKYHTRMFPDSKLRTEKEHIIEDISHTNSIEKIYLSGSIDSLRYKRGDIIVIYRTGETPGRAWYEAVATSICTVVETKNIYDFTSQNEFIKHCIKYSVFSEAELREIWMNKKYKYLIKMVYNIALDKRPIRRDLVQKVRLDENERWVVLPLTDQQIFKILELGDINENLIID